MKKEPLILYLFRLGLRVAFVVTMGMLWWSSQLVEFDLNQLRQDLREMKRMIQEMPAKQVVAGSPSTNKNESSLADPSLPNLLEEDPFYSDTLPKILGDSFIPHGVRYRATILKPKTLSPFSGVADVNDWVTMCQGTVAKQKFGIYETMAPYFAWKMEQKINPKTGKSEFWVHLRRDLFWEPISASFFEQSISLAPFFQKRHQVTAHDFKFWYDVMMNSFVEEAGAVAARTYYEKIEQIVVLDDYTFVVRWKSEEVVDEEGKKSLKIPYAAKLWTGALQPLASFVYKYFADGTKIVADDSDKEAYRNHSVWAQNFSQHWAKNIIPSCGPWLFTGMTDRQLTLKRNTNFYDPLAALTDSQDFSFKQSPETMWQAFEVGEIDGYNLLPDQLAEGEKFIKLQNAKEKEEQMKISRLDYLMTAFNYVGWNAATPYFSDKKIRRAMTLAIDRERIIRTILNGMGTEISGPFMPTSPSYDQSIKPLPYDPEAAKVLLEEEGWYDRQGLGVRSKSINGKEVPFSFVLVYYVKNPTSAAISAYISTALKKIGVDCRVNGLDLSDLSATFEDKSFDAIYFGWRMGTPPEDPRQIWYSSGAKQKGSSNAVGFANKEADKIIDALQYEQNREKRQQLYHRFHEIIYEEQPYTFLYCIKVAYLYRNYLKNVFLPSQKQELIPGANVDEPQENIFYIERDLKTGS